MVGAGGYAGRYGGSKRGTAHQPPTVMISDLSIPDLVARSRTLYTAARDTPEIATALADPFGYGPDDYAEGLALVQEVESLDTHQKREYGEQRTAVEAGQSALDALSGSYTAHRRIARAQVARNSAAYANLGLSGNAPRTQNELISAARTFYTRLSSEPTLTDGVRGLDADTGAEGLALVTAATDALTTRDIETGQAQRATSVRDDAVSRLRTHARELAELSRIALADTPQLREVLGLLERS